MKKHLLKTILLLFALVAGTGSVWAQKDMSAVHSSNVNFSAGFNSSSCTVNSNAGVKCGTNSKKGKVTITVPAGTKYLHLHAVGWNGESITLSVSPTKGVSPTSISLTSDSGISGNTSAFTLDDISSNNFYKVVTFSTPLASQTSYEITTSSNKNRFVIWGINAEALPSSVTIKSAGVSVSDLDMTVGGEDVTLTATVLPATANQSVTWQSSDPSVATVVNGLVHAVADGNATITATSTLNTVYATCYVTVAAATSPVATVSTTDLAFGEVEVGQTKELTFTVTPANLTGDLTIASSNDKYTISPSSIAQSATGAQTITVTAAPTALNDNMDGTVTISGGGLASDRTVTVSASPYVVAEVTLNATNGDIKLGDEVKTSLTSRVGNIVTLTAVPNAGYLFDGWTAVGATPANSSDAEQEFTFTEANPVLTANFIIDPSVTYDFSEIDGFSDWGTSYSERTVTYADAIVKFASANHQTSTITDVPVTKGGDVTLTLRNDGETLKSVKFVCKQWGSKEQTITLHYSTDGGENFSTLSPSVTSTNFTIQSNNLPEGTNAVKISFSSSGNQVGIASASVIINRVESITVSAVGYATYCSANALDFTGSEVKAYVGKVSGGNLTFTPVTKVPANTGLLLYKEGGATVNVPVIASAAAVGENCLTGVNTATTITSDDYILNKVGENVGFYKAGSFTSLAAHRAYISASAGIKNFVLNFDETDGISVTMSDEENEKDGAIYNLAGQRVTKATKGIYVKNGRKFIVK